MCISILPVHTVQRTLFKAKWEKMKRFDLIFQNMALEVQEN